jgi:hypothetical protein
MCESDDPSLPEGVNQRGQDPFGGAWRGAGLSGLFGLFRLFGSFGSENEINEINQIDQTNQLHCL